MGGCRKDIPPVRGSGSSSNPPRTRLVIGAGAVLGRPATRARRLIPSGPARYADRPRLVHCRPPRARTGTRRDPEGFEPMSLDWNWLLIIGGALLVLVEVALGGFAGFDLVLIGSAFVVGGAIGLWLGNPAVGLIVAARRCASLYIVAGRRWVRAAHHARARCRATPTRSSAQRAGDGARRRARARPGQGAGRGVARASPRPASPGPSNRARSSRSTGVDGVTLQVR